MARFFIDRPIFAWVIAIVIMLAGALSIHRLALSSTRHRTDAGIGVNHLSRRLGAYPEDSVTQVIEQKYGPRPPAIDVVNQQLERQRARDAGVHRRDHSDVAMMQVQNKVQQALTQLPDAVQDQV